MSKSQDRSCNETRGILCATELGRGPHGDATYQISNLYAFQFQRRRILKIGFFVPMFQLMTPKVGPVLSPGASYEQT